MKKTLLIITIFCLICLTSLSACFNPINNSKEKQTVTLTFIQLPYVFHEYNQTEERIICYFENEEIMRTTYTFEKGYYLTTQKIEELTSALGDLKYQVPQLNGDGYWSFTIFATQYDPNTGIATTPLSEGVLTNDLTVYFAIYG